MSKINGIVVAISFVMISIANASWPAIYNYANDDDEARAVAVDAEGYVTVAGYATNAGGLRGRTVIRYDNTGTQKWVKSLWGSGHSEWDALALLSSGDIVVTGVNTNTNEDLYVARYDKTQGTQGWEKVYNGGDTDRGKGIAVYNDNIIVVGYSFQTTADIYLAKYSSSGSLLWETTLDLGGFETPEDVAVDLNGNIVICGEKINSNMDYLIIKCSSSGSTSWTKEFNGGGIDYAHGITTDSQGNIIVTGRRHNGTNYDYWTIKLSPSGTVLWDDIHDTDYPDYAHDVCVDAYDSIVVAGSSLNTASGWINHYIVKYAPNGTVGRTLRDNLDTDAMANGVALATNGSGYVTGYMDHPSRGFDFYTVRYPSLGLGIVDDLDKNVSANEIVMNICSLSRNHFYVDYYLPQDNAVDLKIYDMLGCKIRTLVRGNHEKGWYSVQWDGTDNAGRRVPSGVYFCQLSAANYHTTEKLLLIK